MHSISGRTALGEALILAGAILFFAGVVRSQTYKYKKQGYSSVLCLDNRGTFGRTPYPGVIGGTDPGGDSVGFAYPVGQHYEHIFGAGLWVGGLLDTAESGTSTPLKLVSVGYEGWNGPYFEFFPGTSPADTIWEVTGRGVQRPSSWDAYWGTLIPTISFSDNDHYYLYDDNRVRVAGHVPLRLKVGQSSFTWSDPVAEAIHIVRYRIVNAGFKQIDSAYVGVFLDGDVGPYSSANYAQRNYTGYYSDLYTAFIHNPVDIGSTPVGVTLLDASRPLDSLRYSFRWWGGTSHPTTDVAKYQILTSGTIDSDQSTANLSDARCLISFGPFTLHPSSGPGSDTISAVFAIESGQNLSALRLHAERATIIYFNGGQVAVEPPNETKAVQFRLLQNFPNPFNPATTIRFVLPQTSNVRLSIVNTLGEEVENLVNQSMPMGVHAVVWDASRAPSGVYFFRIQAGHFVETRKMVLLR